jgi:hypothetical protein
VAANPQVGLFGVKLTYNARSVAKLIQVFWFFNADDFLSSSEFLRFSSSQPIDSLAYRNDT